MKDRKRTERASTGNPSSLVRDFQGSSGISKGHPRRERVAHVLREAITEALAGDVKDPRVAAAAMLTVTRVEMNVDMSIANVYVSAVGDADAAVEGLRQATSFLRGRVGRAAGLQRAPELRFFADYSIDMSEKIAGILRDDAERASAANRADDEAGLPRQADVKDPVS